ncbi:ATPase, T2SS/T4P/T4SS family, partial [Stenotrophomonas sp. MH1]
MPPVPVPITPGKLQFSNVAAALLGDGLVAAHDQERIRFSAQGARNPSEIHPLVLLANLKLAAAPPARGELALERLTEWLAGRTHTRYLRIDPTRVDVAAATAVVSHAYARRHRILPLGVDSERVLVATSEPLARDWVPDLQHLSRRRIEVVLVNPLDLHRYTMEFFGVTRSIRNARNDSRDGGNATTLPSFEQLVELGSSGDVNADDHHVVSIVDWLLQYAYEQRASDIHMEPRRDMGRVRFRIDGVLHKVFEMPPSVMTAVVSRVKVLGRMDL